MTSLPHDRQRHKVPGSADGVNMLWYVNWWWWWCACWVLKVACGWICPKSDKLDRLPLLCGRHSRPLLEIMDNFAKRSLPSPSLIGRSLIKFIKPPFGEEGSFRCPLYPSAPPAPANNTKMFLFFVFLFLIFDFVLSRTKNHWIGRIKNNI